MEKFIDQLHFDEKGLIPAIIQDAKSGEVLTLCYMDRDAVMRSMKEGRIYVFRRSRGRIMLKGETSGHIQIIKELYADCENNSLLFKVEQKVAACHAGYFTCYFQKVNAQGEVEIVGKKIFEPGKVY